MTCKNIFNNLTFFFFKSSASPVAVPPQSSSGSVLYLSPSLLVVKLSSQGFYPGTVAGIELTQRLVWAMEQKKKGGQCGRGGE